MNNLRINNLLKEMRNEGIEQILVSSTSALFYLTGEIIHPGERMISLYLNTNGKHKFIVNKLFVVNQSKDLEYIWYDDIENPIDILSEVIDSSKALGIDKDWKAHFLIGLIDKKAAKSYFNASSIIDKLRMIKDEEEKELMREASRINDKVMSEIKEVLATDKTEKEIASILAERYEDEGTEGCSFPPIVAYGGNAADPHCTPGYRKIKEGDCVVVDTGCRKNSYCSDMTRTFFYKKVSDKHREIYEIVLEANKRAINTVKAGVKFSDVDKAARDYITEKGYGEYFTHRTGHCIGIEVHDFGNVSSVNDDLLKPGMIFSIEPGIYLKDDIGVRIEDLVMVTEDGVEILNKYNKELTIIK